METLIKIQEAIMRIERLTLDVKYRSEFNYNYKSMYVDTYCWQQAAAYKQIFDGTPNVCIYFEENSKLQFLYIGK